MLRVALVGAGLMGEPIAGHLLDKGFPVATSAHLNRAPIDRLVRKGARECATLADATGASDVTLMILPTSREVEQVLFGTGGIGTALKPGHVVVDMGTCYPADTRRLAARVIDLGARFLDAPVTGGVEAARAGTITTIVGGEPAVLDLIRPVLEAFSAKVYHFGPIGAGHAAKLIQNMIGWIEVAGIAEGLALAKATGLDLGTFFSMLSHSHSNSPIVQMMVPKVLAGGFDAIDFRLELAHKDIRQAADLAREATEVPMTVANAAEALFRLSCAEGFGKQDWTAIVCGLERSLGVEFRAPAEQT
jgi:3-hydroxyisobutyrate dehydrogenase-like beta-hydroxyacid dehydrogenase